MNRHFVLVYVKCLQSVKNNFGDKTIAFGINRRLGMYRVFYLSASKTHASKFPHAEEKIMIKVSLYNPI